MSNAVAKYGNLGIAAVVLDNQNAAFNLRSVSPDFVDTTFIDTVSEWKYCEYEPKTEGDVQVSITPF